MKKITLENKRLRIKKASVARLGLEPMPNPGPTPGTDFTYALSWGHRCKISLAVHADNPFECGEMISRRGRCDLL